MTVLQAGRCGVRFTAGARTFALFLNVQTGCGLHPVCYSVDDNVQTGCGIHPVCYSVDDNVQTGCGIHPVCYSVDDNVWTGCGIHPVCYSVDDNTKQPVQDADHRPSFSAEMKNEWKYYLLTLMS